VSRDLSFSGHYNLSYLGDEGADIGVDLSEAAVRNWEYMVEHRAKAAGKASKDFFVACSKHPLNHKLMQAYGLIKEIEEGFQLRCQPADPESGGVYQEYLPGKQRRFTIAEEDDRKTAEARWREWYALWTRFWFSMLGGVGVIAPMLLMVLHQNRATALATTSCSVFLFALVLAFATKAPPEVAVNAVAAYAAVLVAFVGSSLPPSVV
jgi:hypothetical protein